MEPVPGSLSDADARRWYREQLDRIWSQIPENLSKELQARQLIELRNRYKRQARDLMADREKAAELDTSDPIRPVEYYVEKGKAKGYTDDALWDYLIRSSRRSRSMVDQLFGLEEKPSQRP